MAVASIWRRAWKRLRSRGSSEDDADGRGGRLRPTGGEGDADGGGGWQRPTGGYISSFGTTNTASTITPFNSHGEAQPRDIHASMAPSTAPMEENAEEELDIDVDQELEEDRVEKLEHLKGLAVQFRGDNRSALERWLLELDVPWVIHLAPGTHESSGSVVATHGFQFLVQSWILALHKIRGSILTSLDGWSRQRQDQDEGRTSKQPSASEFAQLVQAIVLKMLPFVDIAVAKTTHWPGVVAQKLQVLIDMHDALSMASQHVLSLLSCYVQEECSNDKMRELLSADLTKLDEAIWDTAVEMRNNIMAWSWTDDSSSCDIHKVSHSIVSYAKVLWANCKSVNRILHAAVLRGEFVSENKNLNHVTNLITQMVSSLEREPSTNSSPGSFPDESLRFLFLINNFKEGLSLYFDQWTHALQTS